MSLMRRQRGGDYAIFKSNQDFEYRDAEGIRAFFQAGMSCTKLKSKEELKLKNTNVIDDFFWIDDFVEVGFSNTPFFFNNCRPSFLLTMGAWDMTAVANYTFAYPTGISFQNIKRITGFIIDDATTGRFKFTGDNAGYIRWFSGGGGLDIYFSRSAGSFFNAANFSSVLTIPRGYGIIELSEFGNL